MSVRFLSLAAVAAAALVLAACGKTEAPANTAPAAAPTAAATPAPAPAPAATPAPEAASATAVAAAPAGAQGANVELGKSVYGKTCAMCHAAGVGGAPKPGDKADWDARAAQGMDVLVKHATEGFTGQKGMMPPKGGNAALTDEEIKGAVTYMATK